MSLLRYAVNSFNKVKFAASELGPLYAVEITGGVGVTLVGITVVHNSSLDLPTHHKSSITAEDISHELLERRALFNYL